MGGELGDNVSEVLNKRCDEEWSHIPQALTCWKLLRIRDT